jgi:hypothetical protein
MPQAIAYVAAAVADFAAAYLGDAVFTAVYYATEVAVTVAISVAVGALTAPKPPKPGALQTPLKEAMPVRQSAFGRVRVAGSYALYTAGSGGAKTVSYDVLPLLDGRSHQVVNYYLNDDQMALNGLGYWYAPGAFGKYGQGTGTGNLVQIDSRLGLAAETAYAISAGVPAWTSDHRGDGVTSMVVVCKQAHKEDQASCFPNGVPTPSAAIDAQLIFDPRDSSQTQGTASTYAFSDGPPLCLLAYLTDASGGMGLDYNRFLAPTIGFVEAAADECDGLTSVTGMHATLAEPAAAGDTTIHLFDTTGLTGGMSIVFSTETVTVSSVGGAGAVTLSAGLTYPHSAGDLAYWDATGQQALYRCCGTYRHDNAPGDVIKSILSTFDGWLGQRGDGALVVRTNTVYTPSVILTDRHIVGYQVQHFLPDEQAVNQLIVSYTDPAAAFNNAEAGYVQDDGDIASRGQLRSQQLQLDWVPSGPQAITVATAVLNRGTQPLRGTLTCNLAGLAVMGERYVRVQISELPDLNDLVVEVTGKPTIDLSAMTVSFPWIATGAGSVSGAAPPLAPPSAGSPAGLDPLDAPIITSVTPDYPDSGGGVSGARLSVVVDDPGLDNLAWKVRWKLSADSIWASAGDNLTAAGSPLTLITGLVAAAGSVDVQVAYSTANQTSPWSATTTVTVAAPVGAVSSTPKSASFTTTAGNNCYFLDTSGGAYTVTLNAAPALDEVVEVWDAAGHAGTNLISFNGNGKNISGSATLSSFIAIDYGHARLIYDGTQWLLQ